MPGVPSDPAEHTELLTGGPFAVVRNPTLTAVAVTSLGITLMVPDAVSAAATAVLIAAIQIQVRAVEEPLPQRGPPRPVPTTPSGSIDSCHGLAGRRSLRSTAHSGSASPRVHNL
ncbi:methyltransferase [Virgisporangium aurantiacum]|uniref:Uncharacterized protein n=1 Tax=Virgisporangium aurantiacum TaxID=175570 RepID=A0A8J4E816_9ACTN|nr:hypothetical protein Vau01_122990 [Virgisporangium aurantiacum]